MQVHQQVAEGLASTRCGVSGIRSSLLHSPDMLKKGLQLLLVVLRLSTAACEAAIGSSFPQVRCQQSTLCCNGFVIMYLRLPNITGVAITLLVSRCRVLVLHRLILVLQLHGMHESLRIQH